MVGVELRGELCHRARALLRVRAGRSLVGEPELGIGLEIREIDLGAGGDARRVGEILHRADDTAPGLRGLPPTRGGRGLRRREPVGAAEPIRRRWAAARYRDSDQGVGATSSTRLPKGSSTNARSTPGSGTSRASRSRRPRGARAGPRARGVAHEQRGMGLRRGREGLGDADVQLAVAAREPAAAPPCECGRLRELGQPQRSAVERARLGLAAGGCRDLHVIDADDRGVAHPATALLRSMSTTSRHVPCSVPMRSRTPTTRNPQRS